MKILLTGKPGIGKSTILEQVKEYFKGDKFGIISRELRNKDGNRVGFEAIDSCGNRKTFAHISDIKSDHVVGGKYFVDLAVIDKFAVPEIMQGINNSDALIFIDEIGRMQAFSKKFLETVIELLNSNSNILATIVHDPEPWSIQFKTNNQTILVQVSELNRDLLPKLLKTIYENSIYFHKLKPKQQKLAVIIAKQYFAGQKYIQISKLFKNAIPYLVQGKVRTEEDNFKVTGNKDEHIVKQINRGFVCDCDLFNGRGQYIKSAGECSHIQAVKLSQVE